MRATGQAKSLSGTLTEPERLGEVFQALYPELMRMARSRLRGQCEFGGHHMNCPPSTISFWPVT